MDDEIEGMVEDAGAAPSAAADLSPTATEESKALCAVILDRIKTDKRFFERDFKQMRADMRLARYGCEKWPEGHYRVNLIKQHLRSSTAALYAKNPTATAKRRPRLDFEIWDGTQESLQTAMMVMQNLSEQGYGLGPDGTATTPDGTPAPEQIGQMFREAAETLNDYRVGMEARRMADKLGKTLEILFAYFLQEQMPIRFKESMKHLVRRAKTCSVGYVRIGFQREFDTDADVTREIADMQNRIQLLERAAQQQQDPNKPDGRPAEIERMRLAAEGLAKQKTVLVREGLVFDFPRSTRVIPDRLTESLAGFQGARWVTIEHPMTVAQCESKFGVDLQKSATRYSMDGAQGGECEDGVGEVDGEMVEDKSGDMVSVFEHFDKEAGVVFICVEGHDEFLRAPSAPEIYVEGFFPVFALVFGAEESDRLFPVSEVRDLADPQAEYNRSRQGKREHRQFARPRVGTPTGALSEEEKTRFSNAKAFDVIEFSGGDDISKLLQPIQTSGVDPNLYDTGEVLQDVQLATGSQEAQMGITSGATATESAIADGSASTNSASDVDDLDSLLVTLARTGGQILMGEMSEEQVREIVGPGAYWPPEIQRNLAGEVLLEVEAGSSGRPNQARELRNLERIMPYLLQLPGIKGEALAREALRRLDDRLDLESMLSSGAPSIMALNGMTQSAGPDGPASAPDAQGGAGAQNKAPVPGPGGGSLPPMGDNRV